jgi:hypothetical protein
MVGLFRNLASAEPLKKNATAVVAATKQLFEKHEAGTFTGRGNTKADINERIALFDKMIREVTAA